VAKQISRNDTPEPGTLPGALRGVSELIDSRQLSAAREQLESSSEDPRLVELMRLKLAVVEQRLEPSSALQSVLSFLRQDPRDPTALGLYQELSMLQYEAGRSCPSHSHPPPRGRD